MEKILKVDFLLAFGENIKKIRISQGVTQKSLAFDCNMEPASMNRIECGKVNTSVYTLRLICGSLGIQSNLLFQV